MKRIFAAGLTLALLAPACAFAQSAFNGTWETQLNSIKGMGKPLVIQLKDGMFVDNSPPAIRIKADGQEHPVSGHPGFDSMAVKVVNDHTIEITQQKNGKETLSETVTAAPGGKTATFEFTDKSGSAPVTGKGVVERVAQAPAGSNAVAGSWKFGHWEDLSANARESTYKVDARQVSFSNPTGDSYTAEIGGKPVPLKSSSEDGTMVAVSQVGKDGLRETYTRDGKVVRTSTMTVSPDGKTMKVEDRNERTGRAMTMVADKRS